MRYDVIVIGAGHNGLTTATALAQTGRKVLVLEKRAIAGGLAASEEFHPNFRTQGLLQETVGVRASVVESLGLKRRGLKFRDAEPGVFIPESNGPGVLIHRDADRFDRENPDLPEEERKRYREFRAFLGRVLVLSAASSNRPRRRSPIKEPKGCGRCCAPGWPCVPSAATTCTSFCASGPCARPTGSTSGSRATR